MNFLKACNTNINLDGLGLFSLTGCIAFVVFIDRNDVTNGEQNPDLFENSIKILSMKSEMSMGRYRFKFQSFL